MAPILGVATPTGRQLLHHGVEVAAAAPGTGPRVLGGKPVEQGLEEPSGARDGARIAGLGGVGGIVVGRQLLEEREQEVVVRGDDEQPGPQVERDDNAPEVAPWRDAGHGTDAWDNIVDLERAKRSKGRCQTSNCCFFLFFSLFVDIRPLNIWFRPTLVSKF